MDGSGNTERGKRNRRVTHGPLDAYNHLRDYRRDVNGVLRSQEDNGVLRSQEDSGTTPNLEGQTSRIVELTLNVITSARYDDALRFLLDSHRDRQKQRTYVRIAQELPLMLLFITIGAGGAAIILGSISLLIKLAL